MRMCWQYLAGFFDGDGCLTHNKIPTTGRVTPSRIQLTQSGDIGLKVLTEIHEFLLERGISNNVSTQIRKGEKRKTWQPVNYLYINSERGTRAFLRGVLPYIKVKNGAAVKALDYLSIQKSANKECVPLDDVTDISLGFLHSTWAYVAGFFDAEGCLNKVRLSKLESQFTLITIGQTGELGKEVISWLKEFYASQGINSGIVVTQPNSRNKARSSFYLLQMGSKKSAKIFISNTLPFLRVKKTLLQDAFRYLLIFPRLPSRTNPNPVSTIDIKNDYALGLTVYQISKKYGCDWHTVRDRLDGKNKKRRYRTKVAA